MRKVPLEDHRVLLDGRLWFRACALEACLVSIVKLNAHVLQLAQVVQEALGAITAAAAEQNVVEHVSPEVLSPGGAELVPVNADEAGPLPEDRDALVRIILEQRTALQKQGAQLTELRRKLKLNQQTGRRTVRKVSTLKQDVLDQAAKGRHVLEITRRGKERLTLRGSLSLGLRRGLSNVAACDMGLVLCENISSQTVLRSEIMLATSHTGYCVLFHAAAHSLLADGSRAPGTSNDNGDLLDVVREGIDLHMDGRCSGATTAALPCQVPCPVLSAVPVRSFQYACHGIRSDATNSNVWHRSKVQNTQVESCYLLRPEAVKGYSSGRVLHSDVFEATNRLVRYTDLQRVTDATGPGAFALIKKQVESLGCPAWTSLPACDVKAEKVVLHCYCYTSDHGPDQVAVRNAGRVQCADQPNVLWVEDDCKPHQLQIIYKNGLMKLDALCTNTFNKSFSYFSTLAKLVNCWRDHMAQIFLVWCHIYGPGDAVKKAKTYMPKCLGGRWGSVSAVEKRLDKCGFDAVTRVLRVVLQKKVKEFVQKLEASRRKRQDQEEEPIDTGCGEAEAEVDHVLAAAAAPLHEREDQGLDTLRIEEQAAHRARVGRWQREVLAAVQDPVFWGVVRIARESHDVLDHFLNWMQVPISDHDLAALGGKQAQVVYRADAFCREFWDLTMNDAKWDAVVEDFVASVGEDSKHDIVNSIMELNLQHTGGFLRRIYWPAQRSEAQ